MPVAKQFKGKQEGLARAELRKRVPHCLPHLGSEEDGRPRKPAVPPP